jgi:hypothetical protein
VRIATRFEEGMLVFDDEQRLVAMLTHLSEQNEIAPRQWFLKAGFGRLGRSTLPPSPIWMRHKTGSAGISPAGQEMAVPHTAFPAV